MVNSGGGHRGLSSEWEGIGTNSVLEGQMGIFLLHEFPGLSSIAYPAVIDQRTLQEETALYLATCRGHVDCLQFLLQAGAEPDISNKSRETPLYKGEPRGVGFPQEKSRGVSGGSACKVYNPPHRGLL